MKKSILTFVLSVFATTFLLAQAQENVKFGICGTTENTVIHADLSKCDAIIPLNKNLIINSFTIAIYIANSDATKEGVYADYACTGNHISAAALEALKKAPVGTKFLIESIKASDGKTENKYPGFSMQIK